MEQKTDRYKGQLTFSGAAKEKESENNFLSSFILCNNVYSVTVSTKPQLGEFRTTKQTNKQTEKLTDILLL